MRRILATLFLASLVVSNAACTRTDRAAGPGGRNSWTLPGHLRIGTTDEPDALNPMFAHTDATDQVDALIFAPLFRYGPTGDLVPDLATEVPTYRNGGISADSKTITLHLRPNLEWSDGAPLTASDLRYTYRATIDKRNPIKLTAGWDDITGIDVPNATTAVVHLREANADVLGLFGGGGGASYPPLPEHLLKDVADLRTAPFNAHPISSGPFILKAWNHGSSLEFEANPKYWRGKPKLDRLSIVIVPNSDSLFNELRTHDIDVITNVQENLAGRLHEISGITVAKHLISSWRRLAINCNKPALADRNVRLAIAEAIDWDGMNQTVYHGYNLRAVSDIPPDSWAAPNIPLYPHDPKNAARLLDDAGWRMGPGGVRAKNGVTLDLTIYATNRPGNEQAEVLMQQALKPLGIALSIKNFPASYLFAQNGPLYGGQYDLEWSINTNGPDPDNEGEWSSAFLPPHGGNTSWLRDPIVDQTSHAALQTFDRAKRKALYQREEERIHELVPNVFFYWENTHVAYNSDLRGYKPAEYITDNWNSWEWEI